MTPNPMAYWPGRDFFVASYPKSGRTWLRMFLANYLVHLHEIPIDINLHTVFCLMPEDMPCQEGWHRGRQEYIFAGIPAMPRGIFTHELFRYGLPEYYGNAPVIFVTRDPYQVLESYYHHCTTHYDAYHLGERYRWQGTKEEFLLWAAQDYVTHWNSWTAGFTWLRASGNRYMTVSYEYLHAGPRAWKNVIDFLGWEFSFPSISFALHRSSFEFMLRQEIREGMPGWDGKPVPQNGRRCRTGSMTNLAEWMYDADLTRKITEILERRRPLPEELTQHTKREDICTARFAQ